MDMKTAVLVTNLGAKDGTRTISYRRYLSGFLGDGIFVDVYAILRYILVNLRIALKRGFRSATFYNDVWTGNGSPLKYHLNELVEKLEDRYGDDDVYG
jgi:ferrochelatase